MSPAKEIVASSSTFCGGVEGRRWRRWRRRLDDLFNVYFKPRFEKRKKNEAVNPTPFPVVCLMLDYNLSYDVIT